MCSFELFTFQLVILTDQSSVQKALDLELKELNMSSGKLNHTALSALTCQWK